MTIEHRIRLTDAERGLIVKWSRGQPPSELGKALVKRLKTMKRGKGRQKSPRFRRLV